MAMSKEVLGPEIQIALEKVKADTSVDEAGKQAVLEQLALDLADKIITHIQTKAKFKLSAPASGTGVVTAAGTGAGVGAGGAIPGPVATSVTTAVAGTSVVTVTVGTQEPGTGWIT